MEIHKFNQFVKENYSVKENVNFKSIPTKTLQTINNAAAKINRAGGVASTDELKIGKFVFVGKDEKQGTVQAVGNGKDEITISFDKKSKTVNSGSLMTNLSDATNIKLVNKI